MTNPEIQFKQYQPDYSGMTVTEHVYGKAADVSGMVKEYVLDVIRPENCNAVLPAVFFVHGGGFLPPCDRRQAYISWIAKHLTAAGYAVVSPDYPIFRDEAQMKALGGESAGYSAAGTGIHLAYQFLCDHEEEFHIDRTRIAIMGGSAGAMTACYAVSEHPDHYQAFINLWGVPEILPDLSGFPPVLSVHGTADRLVPYERELPFQEKLAEQGIEHRLISLEGMDHTPLHKLDEYLPAILDLLQQTTKPFMTNTVKTSYGMIQGIAASGPDISAWLGIPYAKAARFHKPQCPDSWSGVRKADQYGPICPQKGAYCDEPQAEPSFYDHEFRDGIAYQYSENCQNLNIWRREGAEHDPVLVYVHGGAFLGGSSHQHCFDGSALAEKGLVTVTVNFRLGIFGGFAAEDNESKCGWRGNFGMYDVLAALRWVKAEIEAFGGDPDNITLMGQSAGARMVQLLIQSGHTTGLVKHAVMSSGAGLAGLFEPECSISEIGEEWRSLLERHGGYDQTALETMEPMQLQRLFETCIRSDFRTCMKLCAPCVDGDLLETALRDDYEAARTADMPVLIGSNAQDMLAEDMKLAAQAWPPVNREKAWHYLFERQLPGDDAGAFHSADLWYWFGTLNRCWRPFEERDQELSEQMMNFLVSFAKDGNPDTETDFWCDSAHADGTVMHFGDQKSEMRK